jgi:hypothetical protein
MKPIQAYYFTINLARAVEALGVKVTATSGRLIGDEELQSLDNNGQYNIPEPMWQTIIFHTKTDEQIQIIKGLERSLRRMDIRFDSDGVDERNWDLDWGFSYDRMRYSEAPCAPTMEEPSISPSMPGASLSQHLIAGDWARSYMETEVPTIQSEEAVRVMRENADARMFQTLSPSMPGASFASPEQGEGYSSSPVTLAPRRPVENIVLDFQLTEEAATTDLPLGFRLEESEAQNG